MVRVPWFLLSAPFLRHATNTHPRLFFFLLGPIIPLLPWDDLDEVLARANLDNAGLGATVYSSDMKRAESIARRLEAGTVWINMSEQPNAAAFFSGFKNSGIGGEMGKQGLLSYTYTQVLQISKS